MWFPRLAVVVGGLAAGALAKRWQEREATAAPALDRSIRKVARDVRTQAVVYQRKFQQLEVQVAAHEVKLKETPSHAELLAAMDALVARTLAGVDERLTAQAQTIETLQLTVTQTDELLERVLESLDLLRGDPDEPAA